MVVAPAYVFSTHFPSMFTHMCTPLTQRGAQLGARPNLYYVNKPCARGWSVSRGRPLPADGRSSPWREEE